MSDMDNDILIDEDGTIRFVYTDLLDGVFGDLPRTTVRASHVEPAPGDAGGWIADMTPSLDVGASHGALILGPFATRQEALDAERAWLRKERGL